MTAQIVLFDLGNVVVDLGGGRRVETDRIDPSVGLTNVVRLGQEVKKGQPLAVVHAARPDTARQAATAVRAAVSLVLRDAHQVPELIRERVG